MDPDQVDAADELVDATAYSGDWYRCAGSEESWARALLRRGWDLSRKVAIAGVAATAAPVVAPPIITLCIAGVALSFPFAACLASLAATDLLMGVLLPPIPPQPYYTYDSGDEESEQEFVDASEAPDEEAPVLGYWSKTEEGAIMEQDERFAQLPLSLEHHLSEELVPLLANEEGDSAEGEFASQESGYELFEPKDGKQEGDSAEGIVMDADNKSVEGVEHYGEENVPSMVTVDDDKDLISSRSRLNASDITDGMTSVGSKPHADHRNQTSCVANKEHGKEEVAEDKCVKTEESKTMDNKVPSTDMAAQVDSISKSLVPDDECTREDEATVEMVLQEVTSSINPVTGEVVEAEVDIIARVSESLPLSDLMAHELQLVTGDRTVDGKMEDIVKGTGDTNVVDVEHQSGEGASSFVSVTSVLTVDNGEHVMFSKNTPYFSAISSDMRGVEARPDHEHHNQTTGVEYKVMDKEFETKVLAEDKDIYKEEQLREQLNTLRTITGYRAVPSLTLEGELAGLYIFVGVEPPHSSGGALDLNELSLKLRLLKSIIGVE